MKSDIPSLIRLGTYPIYIRYGVQKLCCHHCNRWGHAVNDSPYKKHALCIRCGSAGHTVRFCSHPWVLDNRRVILSNLDFTPSQNPVSDSQQQPEGVDPTQSTSQSEMVVEDSQSGMLKQKSESSKAIEKEKEKTKEDPPVFEDVEIMFSIWKNFLFLTRSLTVLLCLLILISQAFKFPVGPTLRVLK